MTTARQRLLFMAPVMPSDRGNGLAMRTGFFLDAYSRQFDVDLAVLPLLSASNDAGAFARARVKRMTVLRQARMDTHLSLVMAISDPIARLLAFRRYGRPTLAGFSADDAVQSLSEWADIDRYDVIHIERLYLAKIVAAWTTVSMQHARLLIDCDEDDARAYRRMAALSHGQESAHWAVAEADAFVTLARELLPRFAVTFVATHSERQSLARAARRIEVIPNLANPNLARRVPRLRQMQRRHPRTVLFVGTMGYAPNADGARWFISRVWPRLRRAFASPLRLLIVGHNPSPSLRRLSRSGEIVVTGTVRDVDVFYRQADLAVIPIRAGGGSRVKLLEAAAFGVPIVSTRLGAEGLAFRPGLELLIADDAGKFARACAAVLRRHTLAQSLVRRAWLRLRRDYDGERWARIVAGSVATIGDEDGERGVKDKRREGRG
jgi:glycosyltransferase involved in cell wall biosynthesis